MKFHPGLLTLPSMSVTPGVPSALPHSVSGVGVSAGAPERMGKLLMMWKGSSLRLWYPAGLKELSQDTQ